MKLLKFLFIFLAALLIAGSADASEFKITGGEILDYGPAIFAVKKIPDKMSEVRVKFLNQTTDIVGRPTGSFGIRYRIDGEPKGEIIKAIIKIKFPKEGILKDGILSSGIKNLASLKLGNIYRAGFAWQPDDRVVFGKYTIQVTVDNDVIVEKEFNVVQKLAEK